jgi:hypothetical protein
VGFCKKKIALSFKLFFCINKKINDKNKIFFANKMIATVNGTSLLAWKQLKIHG